MRSFMEAIITRKPTSFRLRTDLLEGLKRKAALENRILNNNPPPHNLLPHKE